MHASTSNKPQLVHIVIKREPGNSPSDTSHKPSSFRKDLSKPRGRVVLVNVAVFLLGGNIGIQGKPFICVRSDTEFKTDMKGGKRKYAQIGSDSSLVKCFSGQVVPAATSSFLL